VEVTDVLHGSITVVTGLAKEDGYACGSGKDAAHEAELVVPLTEVALVDADSINPELTGLGGS
jgi:putative methionine-R-sulfoxide reductase with GAF domain